MASDREAMRDAVASGLTGSYDCTRVWSAWGVGTMSEDDFHPLSEDQQRIDEIIDAVLEAAPQPDTVAVERDELAYMCPAGCGCLWRDNKDGSMSLYGSNSRSCETCEWATLSELAPVYTRALLDQEK